MAKMNYEKSVARLEEIADKVEIGKLSREEMMMLYDEGTALGAACSDTLAKAQLKISELSAGTEEA